jgi:hypothetical protein
MVDYIFRHHWDKSERAHAGKPEDADCLAASARWRIIGHHGEYCRNVAPESRAVEQADEENYLVYFPAEKVHRGRGYHAAQAPEYKAFAPIAVHGPSHRGPNDDRPQRKDPHVKPDLGLARSEPFEIAVEIEEKDKIGYDANVAEEGKKKVSSEYLFLVCDVSSRVFVWVSYNLCSPDGEYLTLYTPFLFLQEKTHARSRIPVHAFSDSFSGPARADMIE